MFKTKPHGHRIGHNMRKDIVILWIIYVFKIWAFTLYVDKARAIQTIFLCEHHMNMGIRLSHGQEDKRLLHFDWALMDRSHRDSQGN